MPRKVGDTNRPATGRSGMKTIKNTKGTTMKVRQLFAAVMLTGFSSIAMADLEAWVDYNISENVSNVTTVKVDSNMIDKYLEGLSKTWAAGNAIAIELGQMESYSIFVSDLPNGGDFNVVLVTNFSDASQLQPAKENFDAFMAKWSEENQATSDEIVPTYKGIRVITGEYLMREITLK